MRKPGTYILILAGILFLAGCQPSVRFASKASGGSGSANSANVKTTSAQNNNRPIIVVDEGDLSKVQRNLLYEAESWLGTPYCYGGDNKSCTDCSGFTKNIYQAIGVNLPRTAADQYLAGSSVDFDNIKTGDLIFFSKGDKISHVGIYIGNRQFIHASTSNGVIRQSLDDYGNKTNLAGFRRFIETN
jgi:probable lipoprotein NlpC